MPAPEADKRQGHLFRRLCNPAELDKAWLEVLAHYEKGKVPPELKDRVSHRGKAFARLREFLAGLAADY